MSASNAAQEVLYLRTLLKDLKYERKDPTVLFQDNQGSIAIGNDSIVNKRTKHIDIRHHFVRESIKNKEVQLKWVSTHDQLADIFTKGLLKIKFHYLRQLLVKQ